MKNKQPFQFLILTAFLSILFLIPSTKAAYDCAYNITDPSTCCYDGETGYQGVYCNPGEYIQKLGSSSPICKTEAEILTRASTSATKLFVGFNCFNDQLNTTCQNPSTQCYNPSTQACQTFGGPNPICDAANKITECNNSCGSCKSGFISCNGQCVTPQVGTCGAGYTFNQCTGSCSCPAGTTPSGIYSNQCISYFNRFAEIMDFGLAHLGGLSQDGIYDYSDTAIITYASVLDAESIENYISKIYLKSDVAETLNWNSSTLPPVIQNLISNDYRICSIAGDCNSRENCSDGGLCYTPGAISGVCVDYSDCELGYQCDNGLCTLPNSGAGQPFFVGLTPSAYNGDRNGYLAANNLCKDGAGALVGSHVCTSEEIIDTYSFKPSALTGVTEIAWINVAAPGNIEPMVSDCKGWENNAEYPYFGTVWNFSLKAAGLQDCSATKKFACCK